MTHAHLLRDIGLALYGEQWQVYLATDIGVNRRTIRRWLDGEYEPPPGVWGELKALCQTRAKTLAELAAMLGAAP